MAKKGNLSSNIGSGMSDLLSLSLHIGAGVVVLAVAALTAAQLQARSSSKTTLGAVKAGASVISVAADGTVIKIAGKQQYFLVKDGKRAPLPVKLYRSDYRKYPMKVMTATRAKKIPLDAEMSLTAPGKESEIKKNSASVEKAADEATGMSAQAPVPIVDTTPPSGVKLVGAPAALTNAAAATIIVSSTEATHYKYAFDSVEYGQESVVAIPITLADLSAGEHVVRVLARDVAGNYMKEPAEAKWKVVPGKLMDFTEAFAGSAIDSDKYGSASIGGATVKQAEKITIAGSTKTSRAWGSLYTLNRLDWETAFTVSADVALSGSAVEGDLTARVGIEQKSLSSTGEQTGAYCEVAKVAAIYYFRLRDSETFTKDETTVSSASGKMTVSYDNVSKLLTCEFGGKKVSIPQLATGTPTVLVFRAGLHTPQTTRGRISENDSTGAFTATFDNLDVKVKGL